MDDREQSGRFKDEANNVYRVNMENLKSVDPLL